MALAFLPSLEPLSFDRSIKEVTRNITTITESIGSKHLPVIFYAPDALRLIIHQSQLLTHTSKAVHSTTLTRAMDYSVMAKPVNSSFCQ